MAANGYAETAADAVSMGLGQMEKRKGVPA